MNILMFLILSFITIIISINLSKFTDLLDRQTNIGSFFIGGILLAIVTSIPELVTSLSAVSIGNPYLSIGDILGSNIFNLFALSIFDLFFIKYMFMNKISRKYCYLVMLLIVNYIAIFLSFKSNFIVSFFNVGIASIIIVITYVLFLYLSSFIKTYETKNITTIKDKTIKYKFILTSIIMIIISIFLTFTVDNISKEYTLISASSIAAFLLGITTSLPEIVSSITLIRIKNYNLAISNIVGSNMFNLLILSIVDISFRGGILYSYIESSSLLMVKLCILTSLTLILGIFGRIKHRIIYILPSILIITMYMFMLIKELKIIK